MGEYSLVQAIKIDRSKFGQRFVAQFKGKHYFAMSLLIDCGEKGLRQTGLGTSGDPSWIYRSPKQAHKAFDWYTPGEWYNFPAGEKVAAVLLVREDGKVWTKGIEPADLTAVA